MRIVFMGTPDFAVPALEALIAAGHEIAACYTQPPRPAGRGKQLSPSPVQRAAERHGIAVRCPITLRQADEQAGFAALAADMAVVAAYGLILPQPVLDAPRLGCLNLHASLLPRWRGAAPIQRAILAGDVATGITIMRMEAGLDTGPMLAAAATPIDGKTAGELTAELATIGARLIVEVLANPAGHPERPQPEEGVTYAPKIDKAEARLDFARSAAEVERQVRAFAPAPGAFFELEGERVRVLAAEVVSLPEAASRLPPGTVIDAGLTIACGSGGLRPRLVQRAGRPVMDIAALLRGWPVNVGAKVDRG